MTKIQLIVHVGFWVESVSGNNTTAVHAQAAYGNNYDFLESEGCDKSCRLPFNGRKFPNLLFAYKIWHEERGGGGDSEPSRPQTYFTDNNQVY